VERKSQEDGQRVASARSASDSKMAKKLLYKTAKSGNKRKRIFDEDGNELEDDQEGNDDQYPALSSDEEVLVSRKTKTQISKKKVTRPKAVSKKVKEGTSRKSGEPSGSLDTSDTSAGMEKKKKSQVRTGKQGATLAGECSSQKPARSTIPKVVAVEVVAEVVGSDGETEVEAEAVAEESDDESDVRMEVVRLIWGSDKPNGRKKFQVRWTTKSTGATEETVEPAMRVFGDLPEECLKVIWDEHWDSPKVQKWVNGVGRNLKRLGEDWVDFNHFAMRRGWAGGVDIVIANGMLERQERQAREEEAEAHARKEEAEALARANALLWLRNRGEGPLVVGGEEQPVIPIALFPPESPFGSSDGEGVKKHPPSVIEGEEGGGEVSVIGTAATYTPQGSDTEEEVVVGTLCVLHEWETLDKPDYVRNGVLKGRRCHGPDCGKKFRCEPTPEGKRDNENGYWPSIRNPAFHCTACKAAVCAPCRVKYDAKTPPRRKRVPIFYNNP
jgi:hypothetical protein